MRTGPDALALAIGLALLGPASGCASSQSVSESASTSVKSLSTSIQAISRSISRSSEGGGDDASAAAYRRDVRAIAAANVRAGAFGEELVRDLGRVAGEHGIAGWESRRDTYVAIGAGLRDAGAGQDSLRELADGWAGDPRALAWLHEGHGP
jgi:hypothetical protein